LAVECAIPGQKRLAIPYSWLRPTSEKTNAFDGGFSLYPCFLRTGYKKSFDPSPETFPQTADAFKRISLPGRIHFGKIDALVTPRLHFCPTARLKIRKGGSKMERRKMRMTVGVTVLALSTLSLAGCYPHRFYDRYDDRRDRYDHPRSDRDYGNRRYDWRHRDWDRR
jgi:hypothetical protein